MRTSVWPFKLMLVLATILYEMSLMFGLYTVVKILTCGPTTPLSPGRPGFPG